MQRENHHSKETAMKRDSKADEEPYNSRNSVTLHACLPMDYVTVDVGKV